MLKLVVSNETLQLQEHDVDGLDCFCVGEILEQKGSGARVLVIACATDGATGMLMPLPDGEMYEARAEDMQDWRVPYLPGPRLVEVRRKASKRTVWSSYLPDFDAALAVWRKFDLLHPNDFEVEIYTQHPEELGILDACGYFHRVH